MSLSARTPRVHGLSEDQVLSVRSRLQEVLSSSSFSGSPRCQEFLRFVVERALSEDADGLKERAIGAALFGRAADYETATDPIVRVKANDVRRRLTRFNLEAGPNAGVRIELPAGSYMPEFHCDSPAPEVVTIAALRIPAEPALARKFPRALIFGLVGLLAVAAAAFAIFRSVNSGTAALDAFWAPALKGNQPVLISFGRTEFIYLPPQLQHRWDAGEHLSQITSDQITRVYDDSVSAGNLRAMLSVSGLFERYGKSRQVRWPSEVQPSELQDRTVVFIGAFNNPWTMDLNRELRFTFETTKSSDGSLEWLIRDRDSAQTWMLTHTYPEPLTRDYAVITRILDAKRKRVVISAAGMNRFGTQAAGESVSDPVFWAEFASHAPPDWRQKDLQLVLETAISGNSPVRTKVIATHVW